MKCPHCEKTYKSANGLKIHKCKTNKFQCAKCFNRYRTESALAKHKCKAIKFSCFFCKKQFALEKTLISHSCRNKIRWDDRNTKHVMIGYIAFSRFYEKKFRQEKTYDTFMRSSFYLDFTKFGKHIVDLNIKNHAPFLEYLIDREIPLNKWRSSEAHHEYLYLRNKIESWEEGMARSINTMHEWGGDNWHNYFDTIQTVAAVNHIQRGKLSPWLFYSSDKAKKLVSRMNEEQILMIADFLEPQVWQRKIKTSDYRDVCEFVISNGL